MFWDKKKMEEQRRRDIQVRDAKAKAENAATAKRKRDEELKKKKKAEERKRREEEEHDAEKKNATGEEAQKPQAAPILSRGFGFGGGEYQVFKQKLPLPNAGSATGPSFGPPGKAARTNRSTAINQDDSSDGLAGTKGGSAGADFVPLRRPY